MGAVVEVPVKGSDTPARVDAEDAAKVLGKPWRAVRKKNGITYAVYDVRRGPKVSKVLMHRCVTDAPRGVLVDHRDRDGLNNTRRNLRAATTSQNLANAPGRRGTSRFRGVSWKRSRQRWEARLMCKGRTYFLGRYEDEEYAARAFNEKAKEVWGEFALLNQI